MASNNLVNALPKKDTFNLGRYSSNLGQSVPPSTFQTISFNTIQENDTHITQEVGNTDFTIVTPGLYVIDLSIRLDSNNAAVNSQFLESRIQINGSTAKKANFALDIGVPTTGTYAATNTLVSSHTTRLVAGDVITTGVFQSNSTNQTRAFTSDPTYNQIAILRIGE